MIHGSCEQSIAHPTDSKLHFEKVPKTEGKEHQMDTTLQAVLLKYGLIILAYASMTAWAYLIALFDSPRDLQFMIGVCGFTLFVQSLLR